MVAHAKAWATSLGKTRHNPVHGQEEYRVPTDWNFAAKDLNRVKTTASSSTEVEAWSLS